MLDIPVIYILNRTLPKAQAAPILRALQITPVQCAIIHDVLDADLAMTMVREVLRADTEADSMSLALVIGNQTGAPVLVLGTADVLDAVYQDGRKEVVGASC